MTTIEELQQAQNMHRIPKSIHFNKGVLMDYRLCQTLENSANLIGAGDTKQGDLAQKVLKGDYTYDFDVYLPKYGINLQRPYVWEHCQQNNFILSVILEKPIESFVIVQEYDESQFDKRDKTVMHVIDGKQRLLTIHKFLQNEFPIFVGERKVWYRDFDEHSRDFFRSRVNAFTATVYYSYPDTLVDDDMKIILFNYYNFSGTPQTEEHKNKLQSLIK